MNHAVQGITGSQYEDSVEVLTLSPREHWGSSKCFSTGRRKAAARTLLCCIFFKPARCVNRLGVFSFQWPKYKYILATEMKKMLKC